ncbi:MAG: hypothetical protein ACPGLV_06465 [Bacteroidia bacterium]
MKRWDKYLSLFLEYKKTPTILSWAFFVFVLCNAWISDDAYISFTSVNNFVDGLGLVYNVGERVQTFTNPLLVIILIPVHLLFNNLGINAIYYESLAISLCLLMLFLYLIKALFTNTAKHSLALLLLCTNIPIIDYFTSGLENSLNYVLVLLLLLILKNKKWYWLALISGLMVLSRLDLFVLVSPIVFYQLVHLNRRGAKIKYLSLFIMPWLAWELFALIYYGTLIPNSVIAKSSFDPSFKSVLINDWRYILGTLYFHPIAMILPVALFIVLIKTQSYSKVMAIGVVLYFFLPFMGGGDFMSGRFQTVVSVLLITASIFYTTNQLHIKRLAVVSILLFALHPNSYVLQAYKLITDSDTTKMYLRIADEKIFYFSRTSLAYLLAYNEPISNFKPAAEGIQLKNKGGYNVVKQVMAGYTGYYSGANTYLTDKIGIVDPLLARLPSEKANRWRPGHPKKIYPDGYMESLRKKKNLIQNQSIKLLYSDILLVTRSSEFFTRKRWDAIWRLNTGYHKIERGYE